MKYAKLRIMLEVRATLDFHLLHTVKIEPFLCLEGESLWGAGKL